MLIKGGRVRVGRMAKSLLKGAKKGQEEEVCDAYGLCEKWAVVA